MSKLDIKSYMYMIYVVYRHVSIECQQFNRKYWRYWKIFFFS